jgi:hypothetical protein
MAVTPENSSFEFAGVAYSRNATKEDYQRQKEGIRLVVVLRAAHHLLLALISLYTSF